MNKYFITLLLALLLAVTAWAKVDEEVVNDEEDVAVDADAGVDSAVDVDADSAAEADDASDFEDCGSAVDAKMIVEGYEWGPAVPKVIVEFSEEVSGFNRDTFVAKTGGSQRVVLDVYNSDVNGKKKNYATKYVSLEFKCNTVSMFGFVSGDANPFNFDMEKFLNTWSPNYELELDLAEKKSFSVGECEYGNGNPFSYKLNLAGKYVIPETASWKKDSFTKGDITLQRASFTPKGAKTDGVKNPLIIWLHGAGEGGNDIDIALLGNEVVALARDEIQKYFTTKKVKGAYVLAVQTPTMWMDNGKGEYNDKTPAGQKQISKYDAVLFAAIKDYVKHNKDIDTKRIYLGGCSNGGYMTMNLMFEHGDFFTAFYPICEAYMNKNISDEMIEQVKDYNVWLVASEDDTTVDPLISSIPTFYRFIKAGAKNIHYTLYDQVRGTDDPNAIYQGHYSWVYAFNDQVNKEFDNAKVAKDLPNVEIEKETGKITTEDKYVTNANCTKKGHLWSWLAAQRK